MTNINDFVSCSNNIDIARDIDHDFVSTKLRDVKIGDLVLTIDPQTGQRSVQGTLQLLLHLKCNVHLLFFFSLVCGLIYAVYTSMLLVCVLFCLVNRSNCSISLSMV